MSITKMKHHKTADRFKKKRRIRNWSAYTMGLKKRGDITVWFSQSAINQWYFKGKRGHGGHYIYSDHTILTCQTMGMVFHQPLRQQQGLVTSLLKLLDIQLYVPDYTVVSRRSGGLNNELDRLKSELDKARKSGSGKVDMIVDSTGIKIYGEGEWMRKKHRTKIRKSWRKLHLSTDSDGWINATTLTDHLSSDESQADSLRTQINQQLRRFIADGAYDSASVCRMLIEHNIDPPDLIIPPNKRANLSEKPEFKQRNNHILYRDLYGRDAWEKNSGYTFQSKSENAFFRYKTIIGRKLSRRNMDNQKTEASLGCLILNKMFLLGMPKYES